MALSDCPKCWDTPCCCGYEFFDWGDEYLNEFVEILASIQEYRKQKGDKGTWEDFQEWIKQKGEQCQ